MVKSKIKNVKSIIKTDLNNVNTSLVDTYVYYDKTIGDIEYLNLFKVTNTTKTAKTPKTPKTPKTAKTAKTAKTLITSNIPKTNKKPKTI